MASYSEGSNGCPSASIGWTPSFARAAQVAEPRQQGPGGVLAGVAGAIRQLLGLAPPEVLEIGGETQVALVGHLGGGVLTRALRDRPPLVALLRLGARGGLAARRSPLVAVDGAHPSVLLRASPTRVATYRTRGATCEYCMRVGPSTPSVPQRWAPTRYVVIPRLHSGSCSSPFPRRIMIWVPWPPPGAPSIPPRMRSSSSRSST